jgi:monoamine oxidase
VAEERVDVAVVGAGVGGLSAARALAAAGRSVVVLEGRDRVGGRLLSVQLDDVGLDLGATWFWPGERRVERLVDDLGLATYPQHLTGVAVFEAADAVHRLRDNPLDVPSRRLVAGMQAVAAGLADLLEPGTVRLRWPVREVTEHQDGLAVGGPEGRIRAAHVILAVPPALAAGTLRFDPALPAPLAALAAATPVWMGAVAKVVVRYAEPFWRSAGLAGAAVSHRGPLTEIHDASGPTGVPAALFGFADARADLREERIVEQLRRLFGRGADPVEVRVQNWSQEAFTAPPGVELLTDHRAFGHGLFGRPAYGGRLHWASTETSPHSPGHVEGALAAAELAASAVLVDPQAAGNVPA